jgi:hypothetical protein
MMRKTITVLLGLALALGVALPAKAADGHRVRYVAHDAHFVVLAFVSGWTGVAMEGTISFVPTGDRATVKIDDVLAEGTVPVVVSTVDGARHTCMNAGSTTTLRDLVPNRRTYLYVLDETYRGRCRMGATTGIITLS